MTEVITADKRSLKSSAHVSAQAGRRYERLGGGGLSRYRRTSSGQPARFNYLATSTTRGR